jgi:hypothetical protein
MHGVWRGRGAGVGSCGCEGCGHGGHIVCPPSSHRLPLVGASSLPRLPFPPFCFISLPFYSLLTSSSHRTLVLHVDIAGVVTLAVHTWLSTPGVDVRCLACWCPVDMVGTSSSPRRLSSTVDVRCLARWRFVSPSSSLLPRFAPPPYLFTPSSPLRLTVHSCCASILLEWPCSRCTPSCRRLVLRLRVRWLGVQASHWAISGSFGRVGHGCGVWSYMGHLGCRWGVWGLFSESVGFWWVILVVGSRHLPGLDWWGSVEC